MLVTRNLQPSLWDSVLPAEVRRIAPWLEQVDRWLDDEAFFAPFREHFSALVGRPSIPMEVYLRMMFLKFQYKLGYESLCREVSDSISWRIFCRLNLDGAVPAPSTLSKITTRCGEDAVLQLNESLLARADAAKLVKTGKVRADTTVVSANVEYPTDSGLLARAVTLVGKLVRRIKAAGGATRTAFRDATDEATTRVHAIGAKLKLRGAEAKEQAQATVLRLTGELADLAEAAMADAAPVLANARQALRRVAGRQGGLLSKAINELDTLMTRALAVVAQTRRRVAGEKVDSATRVVSLHEPDARPIKKGRLGKPVEFGSKAQVMDNEDGLILDYEVKTGNPPDAEQLAPAVGRVHKRLGRTPVQVAADRGYGEASVDKELEKLGVQTVVIPRKGKPGKARQDLEHSPEFRDLIKWRTGCEGRISYLKRRYGWDRSLVAGRERTATWCGYGVLAHNLVKVARLEAMTT
jgi:transposase, IS5 family